MNVKLQERFRARLLEVLAEKGISKSELARLMEMTPQAISCYVHGHRAPGLDLVEKFAVALEVDGTSLLTEEPFHIFQATA